MLGAVLTKQHDLQDCDDRHYRKGVQKILDNAKVIMESYAKPRERNVTNDYSLIILLVHMIQPQLLIFIIPFRQPPQKFAPQLIAHALLHQILLFLIPFLFKAASESLGYTRKYVIEPLIANRSGFAAYVLRNL